MTTPLNKNYWAETESLSAETDTSHLNKTKPRDRDFTCGAETVKIGYSAEMTSNPEYEKAEIHTKAANCRKKTLFRSQTASLIAQSISIDWLFRPG